MTDPNVRAVNAAIADNYDAFVYDPQSNPLIDVARVCGVASIFGTVGYPTDVLDLGCGTGAQLAQAASQVRGRIVGTDISPEACRRATERLAPFGERARIICGDLLEIAPEDLGEFDIIYNIGVIYVTPPEVQRRLLEIIGRCLRPQGVAVMSYYAGSVPALRANLHQTLRATCSGLEPVAAIAHARQQLDDLAKSLEHAPGTDILRHAIADTSRQPDLIFFHEVLNNTYDPMRTSAIERTLSQHGVNFASYLPPRETADGQSSIQRAVAADVADFGYGQYRHAVFAKYEGAFLAGFATRPDLWDSSLKRLNRGDFEGEQTYSVPDTDATATIRSPAAMAMFDCLIDGPLSWTELTSRVPQALKQAGLNMDKQSLEIMEGDLRQMWQHGLAFPLLKREDENQL